MYLPNAIIMGVDYNVFWNLTPRKLMPFLKAYEEKKKARLDEMNFMAWMSGIYTGYAVSSVMGEKNIYPEEPVTMFEDEEKAEERSRKEAEAFGAYAVVFNKDFRERSDG